VKQPGSGGIPRGWAVLVVGFLTVVFGYVCRNTFSVFYPTIVDEFGWGRGNTALIFSINLFVYGVVAPFAGGLVDRFRPTVVLSVGAVIMGTGVALCSLANEQWQFYLLYGVVASIGLSVAGWTPVVAVVSRWFATRRALPMGVLGAGFGTSLVFALVAQYIITAFGWRTAYVIIGVFAAATIVPLALVFLRHRPGDPGPERSPAADEPTATGKTVSVRRQQWHRTEWTLSRAARTRQFWMLFIAAFLILGIVEQTAISHQVYFYRDAGYVPLTAAGYYSIFGVCFVLGNLAGSMSDRIGRERWFCPACLVGALSVCLLFLMRDTTTPWIPPMFAVVFGISLGSGPCVFYAAVADLFHGPHYGRIVGMMVLGFALGGTISPWLAGYIHDVTGTYTSVFAMLAVSLILTAALMWLAAPRKVSPIRGST
jgi:MFS family permease